jgi:F-type H+-transporting ATPase subunit alpha
LLRKVPVKSIIDFQTEFLHHLEEKHSDVMKALKAGKYTDEMIAALKNVAAEVAAKYEK